MGSVVCEDAQEVAVRRGAGARPDGTRSSECTLCRNEFSDLVRGHATRSADVHDGDLSVADELIEGGASDREYCGRLGDCEE